ncbi:tetratricopeptide repeat protein, partial [Kitasatospora nipponensis]|uniref:tetratricopeptide repeat protein n=1 Tax=Kitasatospora nipponensis TaxID=258049 RepID=UPI003CD08E79
PTPAKPKTVPTPTPAKPKTVPTPTPAKPKAVPAPAPVPAPAKPERLSVSALRARALEHERNGRPEEALGSHLQAESLGDAASRRDIARLCLRLSERSTDPDERKRYRRRAVKRYRELAEAGEVQALQIMAELDGTNAHTWQLRAAEAGSTKAMRAVARGHLATGGEPDARKALEWLLRAGQQGSTAAVLDGARVHEQRGDYREALDWYAWAQHSGDAGAAREVARLQAEHPGAALWRRVSERLRRPWG